MVPETSSGRSPPRLPAAATGSGARVPARQQLHRLVAADAADDLDPALEAGVLGELDRRSRGSLGAVRERENEGCDVALEQGADTHDAGLDHGEDRGVRESVAPELSSRLTQ